MGSKSSYDKRRAVTALQSYLRSCYERRTTASVKEFAQHVRRSRPYLSRKFPALAGQPISDLMRELQVQRAEHLLRTTKRTTAEIAALSGLGTEMTLRRVFKRLRGMTPGEYRRKVTK